MLAKIGRDILGRGRKFTVEARLKEDIELDTGEAVLVALGQLHRPVTDDLVNFMRENDPDLTKNEIISTVEKMLRHGYLKKSKKGIIGYGRYAEHFTMMPGWK